MKNTLLILSIIFIAFSSVFAQCEPDSLASLDVCVIKTNYGEMQFRFFEDAAPLTSAKFKNLVNEGFYDSLIFYRVVKGHVIQAGDGGENNISTVQAEFNEYPHITGTVGLARSEDPNSGSTEFYICLVPRPHLDGKYTVFGQLMEGYDVLEKIGNTEIVEQYVGDDKNIAFHTPKESVIIEKASIEIVNYFVE
ncbi:MAG: peptidylprolyl isomerase [Candidatus Neomarinimicrobiota bacterium]